MKLKSLIITIALLALASSAFALQGVNNEQIPLTTVVGFTASKLIATDGGFVTKAICSVEGNNIRWWTSATPTTSAGVLVSAGGWFEIDETANVMSFKMVSVTGTAVINCQYYK